jgi:hypothetical protein
MDSMLLGRTVRKLQIKLVDFYRFSYLTYDRLQPLHYTRSSADEVVRKMFPVRRVLCGYGFVVGFVVLHAS